MRRSLLLLLGSLCLLAAAATVAAWCRSATARDAFPEVMTRPGLQVQSLRGRICICEIEAVGRWPSDYQLGLEVWDHPLPIHWHNDGLRSVYGVRLMLPHATLRNGYGFSRVTDTIAWGTPIRGWRARGVAVPYWVLTLAWLGMAAGLLGPLVRQRGWRRAGLCGRCGYDLRASPNRCPECGAEPSRSPAAATRAAVP